MTKGPGIPLFDLLTAFASAADLISPKVVGQSKQVSYIAFSIARELGLPRQQLEDLAIAGLFHDICISSLAEKITALQFQFENATEHARIAAQLLATYDKFSNASTYIRFHHHPWQNDLGSATTGEKAPIGSHILHLADRIAVLVNREQEVLSQVEIITKQCKTYSGTLFVPEIVDSFISLARKECFWLDSLAITTGEVQLNSLTESPAVIDMDGLMQLSKLFSRIIDARSYHSATHTCGAVVIAESLARLMGFSETECQMIQVAANLRDLGNLSIPAEILLKPAALTKEETNVVRQHPYHTFHALKSFDDLGTINKWASFHHEHSDGTGYPFHLEGKDLSPGCRIIAVADIYTAMAEDRPWRKGMTPEDSLAILEAMADKSTVDSEVVKLLKANFNQINSACTTMQTASLDQDRQVYKQKENPEK